MCYLFQNLCGKHATIKYAYHFSSLPSVFMSGILAIFLFKKATDILSNAYKNYINIYLCVVLALTLYYLRLPLFDINN